LIKVTVPSLGKLGQYIHLSVGIERESHPEGWLYLQPIAMKLAEAD
jgi:hypothetical protein